MTDRFSKTREDSRCVLIIEDERRIALRMEKFFKQKGFKVFNTDGPIETFELIDKKEVAQQIDVIILDLMMPDEGMFPGKDTQEGRITGLFLLEAVRKKFKSKKMIMPIVIICTAMDISAILRKAKLSCKAIVQKPCSPEVLYNAI